MIINLMPGDFAIARMDAHDPTPQWAQAGGFSSITRTMDELSIVCASGRVPESIGAERCWRAFQIDGSLDFTMIGVLASIAEPLACASVSIFVISTYDTDYFLVKAEKLDRAREALEAAGHEVRSAASRNPAQLD